MKGEIRNSTKILGEFNTPLSKTGRKTTQKVNKEITI